MTSDPIALATPWPAPDPFLFAVHHLDGYPLGNDVLGPATSLEGRQLGQDFSARDGWSMYHGQAVPGFPQHPHRGFETITIVRSGFVDHSDSLGATARFGSGDVQWMTAGRGIVHSEMFPLLQPDADNPLELFQVWLNLPRRSKLVDPYFTMLWREQIPVHVVREPSGATEVAVIAGRFGDQDAPAAPPSSLASQAEAEVAVWTVRMEPGAKWAMPEVPLGAHRMVYFYRGASLAIGNRELQPAAAIEVGGGETTSLINGPDVADLLVLQGRPIGEPVVQHGPFVMNTREEIIQAIADYQESGFGGWPWPSGEPVHQRDSGRFARHGDGRMESPDGD